MSQTPQMWSNTEKQGTGTNYIATVDSDGMIKNNGKTQLIDEAGIPYGVSQTDNQPM